MYSNLRSGGKLFGSEEAVAVWGNMWMGENKWDAHSLLSPAGLISPHNHTDKYKTVENNSQQYLSNKCLWIS